MSVTGSAGALVVVDSELSVELLDSVDVLLLLEDDVEYPQKDEEDELVVVGIDWDDDCVCST